MERLRSVTGITFVHGHGDCTASNSVSDEASRDNTSAPAASTSCARGGRLNIWILICAIGILILLFIFLEFHLRNAEHHSLSQKQPIVSAAIGKAG